MTAKCRVTFEFNTRPPRTWEGDVKGSAAGTLARRAVDQASKDLNPRSWISFTCVILERIGTIDEPLIKEEDVPLPLD